MSKKEKKPTKRKRGDVQKPRRDEFKDWCNWKLGMLAVRFTSERIAKELELRGQMYAAAMVREVEGPAGTRLAFPEPHAREALIELIQDEKARLMELCSPNGRQRALERLTQEAKNSAMDDAMGIA